MWRRKHPEIDGVSLHRSQIFRDFCAMQAQAAESSGYAGQFRCFLERRIKGSLFRFIAIA
jgi:hypothetical protein